MTSLVDELIEIVGASNVSVEAADKEKYGLDWTRFYSADPTAIVFPRSIEDVQSLVLLANKRNISMVPSGGRTGLSGGAVAKNEEIVVSLERMNEVIEFDAVSKTVTVQAGLITAQLQDFAEEQGLFYPVDFASSGSSQIGGNIATNAGGIKVLRYGLTRDWVCGLTVVTGKGEVLRLNKGLIKNATGYDLRHLFIGSEGTLGFIVEANIQLTRIPCELTVFLLSIPKMTDVISVLQAFQKQVELSAFEFFSDAALRHVIAGGSLSAPFAQGSEFYVLLEFEKVTSHTLDLAMAAFETCCEEGWVVDGVISQSEQQRKNLWRYREDISESITPYTPYKNDVAVRVSRVPEFLEKVEEQVIAHYPQFEIVWFGHIGDGNLHLNILKPEMLATKDFKQQCEDVSQEVLAIVAEFDGSISAEHGVGLLKKNQLGFSRSAEEIALMSSLKAVFDPKGIMNPGKLID